MASGQAQNAGDAARRRGFATPAEVKRTSLNRQFIAAQCLGLLIITAATGLAGCQSDYVPKEKGYNRIDLPPPAYRPLTLNRPYHFEYSKYAIALPDTTGQSDSTWLNVDYPQYGARLSLTYKSLRDQPRLLTSLTEEARRLTSKHQVRAYAIEEMVLQAKTQDPVYAFELQGEVPSQFQFYTTDSTRHFLRGALYFNTASANDSLAPVIEYIKTDIIHLFNTLEWSE